MRNKVLHRLKGKILNLRQTASSSSDPSAQSLSPSHFQASKTHLPFETHLNSCSEQSCLQFSYFEHYSFKYWTFNQIYFYYLISAISTIIYSITNWNWQRTIAIPALEVPWRTNPDRAAWWFVVGILTVWLSIAPKDNQSMPEPSWDINGSLL